MPEDVRIAVERLMIDYCYNVDALDDMERFLGIFTEDAVTDMTAIGLPLMNNREELRRFFEGVFDTMSHQFHLISNFRPESWDGTVAAIQAYVIGMGHAKDGNSVTMQVRYRMECIETADGWKCRHYTVTPMMPLPGTLNEIHGDT